MKSFHNIREHICKNLPPSAGGQNWSNVIIPQSKITPLYFWDDSTPIPNKGSTSSVVDRAIFGFLFWEGFHAKR